MEQEPRLTIGALKVLKVLLESDEELYQAELAERTSGNQASLSRVLGTLEDYDWVSSRAEEVDEKEVGRRARRYYRLTDWGKAHTRDALREVAVKGPLDATDVNQWWSDIPMLNEQGPIHDYTFTTTGVDREGACDAIWEDDEVESLRTSNGYEAWTRDEVSIRLRTNSLITFKFFVKLAYEIEAAYHRRRVEQMEGPAAEG